MSNALAISAVTVALKTLIRDGVRAQLAQVPGFTLTDPLFTTDAPSQITPVGNNENQVNLFLFRVATNPAWVNQPMPPPDGGRLPALPLVLSYLITVVATQPAVHEHQLLGLVMGALHDRPMLTVGLLELAANVQEPPNSNRRPVALSRLLDQPARVAFTLLPLGLDELSKLWSGADARFRLSVAYEASVVLIEGVRAAPQAAPVLSRGGRTPEGAERGVDIAPGLQPTVLTAAGFRFRQGDRVVRELNAGRQTDEFVLRGEGLGAVDTLVFRHTRAGGRSAAFEDRALFTIPVRPVGRDEIVVRNLSQPDAGNPAIPRPSGVYTVHAVTAATADRAGLESNPLTFALVPAVQVNQDLASGVIRVLGLTLDPMLLAGQEVRIRLADREIVLPAGWSSPPEVARLLLRLQGVGNFVVNATDLLVNVRPNNPAAALVDLIDEIRRDQGVPDLRPVLRVEIDGAAAISFDPTAPGPPQFLSPFFIRKPGEPVEP